MRPTRSMPQFGTRVGTPAMKRPMAARRGSNPPTNNHPARNADDTVQSGKAKSERGEAKMKAPRFPKSEAHRWVAATAAIVLAGAAAFVPEVYAGKKAAGQEKEPSHGARANQSPTLADQTDLAAPVYNPNIALARDARELPFPRGISRLNFMDIAPPVNPATV